MKLGCFGWGGLALALGLATPIAARADEAARSDSLSPARLMEGPSLQETGRIGAMTPESHAPIAGQKDLAVEPEKEVAPAAAGLGGEPKGEMGVVDETQLADQITTRFASLENCRIDAARTKQVLPSGVVANTLELRWTILPNGHTGMTTVVATSPTDGEVMDCVKRAMRDWTFVAPRGGSVQVARAYTFRTLPQP
jgi:hypothetical protein